MLLGRYHFYFVLTLLRAAFYSSDAGGITTDRSLMVVPVDDHMVHRGHSVFDTCYISNGYVYGIDFHLTRMFNSANLARIAHTFTKPYIKTILLRLAAESGLQDHGMIKMWLSAGRGDFNISPKNLHGATFYAVAIEYHGKSSVSETGVNEVVVMSVPMKPTLLATIKSTNYLINSLVCMDAEDRGGYLGIQARRGEDGELFVAESPISNIGFFKRGAVLNEFEFVTPTSFGILDGTTLRRACDIMANYHYDDVNAFKVTAIVKRDVKISELSQAHEIIGLGGGFIYSIVKLDGVDVNDGKVGSIFKWLNGEMTREFENNEFRDKIDFEFVEKRLEQEREKKESSRRSGLIAMALIGFGVVISSLMG